MSTSDDTGGDHDGRNALVAEYVLGLLSSAEHERVGRLIEDSAALRAERDFWISRFAALNAERKRRLCGICALIEFRLWCVVALARDRTGSRAAGPVFGG